MSRPISDAWFHRIKSATRDLVKMAGGVVRAGEIANASKSEVSRWQSATDADVISLPAALALEGECGVPLVTSVMAELNGRRLSDPDAEGREASNLFARHAEVLRSSGEMASEEYGRHHCSWPDDGAQAGEGLPPAKRPLHSRRPPRSSQNPHHRYSATRRRNAVRPAQLAFARAVA